MSSMAGYWIRSLNQWAPDEPALSCPDIDDAIQSMESVRVINDELRSDLHDATNLIETLDGINLELQAALDARQSDLQASDELITRMEKRIAELEDNLEEVQKENDDLKTQVDMLRDWNLHLERKIREGIAI
jgi:chromosome segregation ATPase